MWRILAFVVAVATVQHSMRIYACTNFIASSGATEEGSTLIAYNADSGDLYGQLYHYAAKSHPAGAMRQIYDWDTGKYLGEIPEVEKTYNVIGNMNNHGLVIGETTFGGLEDLQSQSGAIMDYGSLIWVTLQRSKNAREAIHTLSGLMHDYGYASEGESFSIADGKEAWIMEIIGKGEGEKGSVWVAQRVPEGAVCSHANQARITTFPLDDPDTCLYAPDVIDFARLKGYYPKSSPDAAFSFSDIYDPVTFTGARFCEARVWSLFGSIMGKEWMAQYEDYATGYNLTNRMPLFVTPPSSGDLVSTDKVMEMMRGHYEGTSLDMSGQQFKDIGATQSYNAYRAHPLTWESGKKTYLNERPVATQQTGWNFVAQTRPWLLGTPLAGILWFGVDDAATTVRFPIYGGATRAPASFAGVGAQDGRVSPMMKFDMKRAFYAFNLVANWAYSRWNLIYPDVLTKITRKEAQYRDMIPVWDKKASDLLQQSQGGYKAAVDYLTEESDKIGDALVEEWNEFFGALFVKYRDGYVITANDADTNCGCMVGDGPYPIEWYDDIARDTNDHYLIPAGSELTSSSSSSSPAAKSKIELLKRR